METQNLWPDFAVETTKSPKAILKEQAGYLMAKTSNVLSADVETQLYKGEIIHNFYVVAPAMNNYRYEIFSIKHRPVGYYPLTMNWGEELPWESIPEARNEEEFIDLLRVTFNKPETTRVISSLLSQSLGG